MTRGAAHEWVMSPFFNGSQCMSHVTHESCYTWTIHVITIYEAYCTCEWVIHTICNIVTYIKKPCHTYKGIISHTWMSHVAKYKWVVSHVWIRHVKFINEGHVPHVKQWRATSPPPLSASKRKNWVATHTWMSHDCTYGLEWVMSHT